MNVAFIKSKQSYQNIVTWGYKCSLLLINKAQKSMGGLFSGVPPDLRLPFWAWFSSTMWLSWLAYGFSWEKGFWQLLQWTICSGKIQTTIWTLIYILMLMIYDVCRIFLTTASHNQSRHLPWHNHESLVAAFLCFYFYKHCLLKKKKIE